MRKCIQSCLSILSPDTTWSRFVNVTTGLSFISPLPGKHVAVFQDILGVFQDILGISQGKWDQQRADVTYT